MAARRLSPGPGAGVSCHWLSLLCAAGRAARADSESEALVTVAAAALAPEWHSGVHGLESDSDLAATVPALRHS